MQFDSMTIEVDGTLENPRVVIAVVLWSLILSACAVKLVSQYQQSQAGPPADFRGNRRSLLVRLAFLFLVTPIAQFGLGNMLYQVETLFSGGPSISSVGFWGGPPVLPAWIVSSVCIWFALRRKAGRDQERWASQR